MSERRIDIDLSNGLFWIVVLLFLLGTCGGGYEFRRVERTTPDGRETRWGITDGRP